MARGLVVLAAATATACSVSQDGIPPPKSRIFLPEGALVDGRWLYVVNSNSDLRYNNGTLAIVDLDKVAADRAAGQPEWPSCPADSRYVPDARAPHGCCWDFLDPAILNCDEQAYIKSDATVRIGSFGGRPQMHLTDFGRRLLIPVRGNSSISVVHLDETTDPAGPRLVCTGPAPKRCEMPGLTQEPFAVCEEAWRIDKFLPASNTQTTADLQNLDVTLPDEPYGMAVDNVQQILYVGHLQTGLLSLIDLAAAQGPRLVTVFGAAVPANGAGSRGITSLLKAEQEQGGGVFVTSRFRPVVTSVVPIGAGPAPTCEAVAAQGSVDPAQCQPASGDNGVACNGARDLAVVSGGETMDTGFANGAETRGVALSHDGQTAWILQRTPPAVVAVDRSPSPITGLPLDLPFASTEVCVNPAFMEAHQAADGLFLYVSCFDTGEIYVVDAQQNRVRDVIEVGRGPAGIVFDQSGRNPNLGYVLGFGANNLSVVDVAPGSPTRHRVIQRIGFPSQTPRDFQP